MVYDAATGRREISGTAKDILSNISYEIMPFRNTEASVVEHVPIDVPLTVTVTEAKGIGPTLELAARLAAHGYTVSPHVAARMLASKAHADEVIAEIAEAKIDQIFVIGGDIPTPTGPFKGAVDFLDAIVESGHSFRRIGIGGYPEGHPKIRIDELRDALALKAPLATNAVTQICFDAEATLSWARQVFRDHPHLEVVVGVPAPVSREKLLRISTSVGLGQSARFLRKQQNVIWNLFRPGRYRPQQLLDNLGPHLSRPDVNVSGIHLYTFNELKGAEEWRQSWLSSLCDR